MAQKIVMELVDDIDGSPIPDGKGEHIEFAVDGVSYEIDLGTKNAKEFRKVIDHYIAHADRTGGRRRRTHVPTTKPVARKRDPAQTRAIREWAVSSGYEVSSRGRIPTEVEEAYNAAQ